MNKYLSLLLIVSITSCGSLNNFNKKKYLNLKKMTPSEKPISNNKIELEVGNKENSLFTNYSDNDFLLETTASIDNEKAIASKKSGGLRIKRSDINKIKLNRQYHVNLYTSSKDFRIKKKNNSNKKHDDKSENYGLGFLAFGILMLILSPILGLVTFVIAATTIGASAIVSFLIVFMLATSIALLIAGITFVIIGKRRRKGI